MKNKNKENVKRNSLLAGAATGALFTISSLGISPPHQELNKEYESLKETMEIIESALGHYPSLPVSNPSINSNYLHGTSRSNERTKSLYTALEKTYELIEEIEESPEIREYHEKQGKRGLIFKTGLILMGAAGIGYLAKKRPKDREMTSKEDKEEVESPLEKRAQLKVINGGRS